MQGQLDMKSLWNKAVDQVKLKVIHPTLWRTLEAAIPLIIENNEFIVGFRAADHHMSGNLTTSEHRNAIETALREFSGVGLNLRVIEGDTVQDWMAVKAKDERMQELKEAARLKREKETAVTKSWDGLMEIVGRRYAAIPLRQLPQFKARYLEDVVKVISETMDVLMPGGTPMDELAERSLARVIDKVGTVADVSPTLIALELERFRRTQR